MIEKTSQKEIVLRFQAGWINMHQRDGDECVSNAAAAPRCTTRPEHEEAAAESVNEKGRALTKDRWSVDECVLRASQKGRGRFTSEGAQKSDRKTKTHTQKKLPHPTNSGGFVFIASQQSPILKQRTLL